MGDIEIYFYVITFDLNDNVEYFKVDLNELYELYKNEDMSSISKQIKLDDILNSDFVFFTNVGFTVYNNSLDKEDLDRILSKIIEKVFIF